MVNFTFKFDGNNGNYETFKAAVKSSPPINEHPTFTCRMPFLLHSQHCLSTEGKDEELWTAVEIHDTFSRG